MKLNTRKNSDLQFVVAFVVTLLHSTVVLAILVLAVVSVTGHCLVTALEEV